jgi:hypothetical protein
MFNVNAGVSSPSPARQAICRAGFGPTPASRALPRITSSIFQANGHFSRPASPGFRSGGMEPNARSSAARTA